jgi:hypothetical protein
MMTTQLAGNGTETILLNTSTLQVKMFVCNRPEDAEKTIAQWLNKNDVTVQHVTQSQSEKGGNFVFVITLFYSRNH